MSYECVCWKLGKAISTVNVFYGCGKEKYAFFIFNWKIILENPRKYEGQSISNLSTLLSIEIDHVSFRK